LKGAWGMAKVCGIHEITLLPGVSEADFERFVVEAFLPNVKLEG
jgi:hypothetical protein